MSYDQEKADLLKELQQERERGERLREALRKCAEPHRWHAPCVCCGESIIEQGCYIAREALEES